MEEATSPEYRYASFMVRVWRQVDGAVESDACRWLGEIEHLQSGQHRRFATLDEVPELLLRQAGELCPG